MYFPYFMAYMTAGFTLSLVVFLWALRNGQFSDQQRARYLPLDDQTDLAPAPVSRMNRLEGYALPGSRDYRGRSGLFSAASPLNGSGEPVMGGYAGTVPISGIQGEFSRGNQINSQRG